MGRILAIDYGLKRIGLALSDPTQTLASPLETVQAERQTEKTLDKLLTVIEAHNIEAIVVGLPYRMSGEIGLQADEVRHFVEALKNRIDVPIHLWDERLTSLQAERAMQDVGFSRKKRAQLVDRAAAVLILQSYLDAHS